jgi:hypothetical protein
MCYYVEEESNEEESNREFENIVNNPTLSQIYIQVRHLKMLTELNLKEFLRNNHVSGSCLSVFLSHEMLY